MSRISPLTDSASYMLVVAPGVITLVSALLAVPSRAVSPIAESRSRSLLELHGLGKEIWKGIDPVAYVRELREEWDR